MADEKKTDEKEKEPAKVTAGDLRSWIREEITAVAGVLSGKTDGKKEDSKTDPTTSVADQVKAELAKLDARKKADDRAKSIDDQLAALTQATQPKAPVERKRPRLHALMGWGDNE